MTGGPAELSVREGYAPPLGLPDGTCTLTRLENGRLRIDQADPRVLMSAELVTEAAASPHPDVELDRADFTHPGAHVGAVLKINAVNRRLVYRLTEYVAAVHGYIAEWPD